MSKLNFRKIKHDVKPENSGPWHSSSEFPFQLGQLVRATCFLLLETLEDLKWIAFFNIAERVHELHDNTVPLEEEFYLFFFFFYQLVGLSSGGNVLCTCLCGLP